MKTQIVQKISFILLIAFFSLRSFGQDQTYINPNAAFDLGVTVAQLNFNHTEGTNADQNSTLANRAELKFKDMISPNQASIEIDVNNTSTFAFAAISEKINQIMTCDASYFGAADLIFAVGFNLTQSHLIGGTECTDCLAEALMDAQLDIGSLASELVEETAISTSLQTISESILDVYYDLQFDASFDANLDQNEGVAQEMKSFIQIIDDLFSDSYVSCNGAKKNYDAPELTCGVEELTEVTQDSTHKVLFAKSSGSEFQWRYRFEGDLNWTIADEKDSVLIIEKTKTGTYEVQVRVWCEDLLDFSAFVTEKVTFNYGHGCYAPSYLRVSHLNKYSAWLHCRASGYKVQWSYRKVGGNWNYLTNRKTSLYYYNLNSNTYYEFRCKVWCGSYWSNWSHTKRFKTPGSTYGCYVNQPSVSNVTNYGATTTVNLSGKKQWAFRARGGNWKVYTNYHTWMKWRCNPGYTYDCKVRIACHGKWSGWSTPASWTTGGGYGCSAPSSSKLSTYNIGASTATSNVSVSASAYKWGLRKRGGSWKYFDVAKTVNWSNLASNTTYDYKVQIYCNGSWSNFSSYRSFTTKSTGCKAPSGYDIWYSNLTSSTVYLKIRTSASKVEYALGHDSWTSWKKWVSTSHSFYIHGMSSNTKYKYSMRVYCNGSWSAWSPVEYFTTKYNGRSVGSQPTEILGSGEKAHSVGSREGIEIQSISTVVEESIKIKLPEIRDQEINTEINVYPNPSADYIKIGGSLRSASIRIVNNLGQEVLRTQGIESDQAIDIRTIEPGSYHVLIIQEDGLAQTKTISIAR